MSLHNNSYLVASHQAEMHRHAAEHRLAAKERRIAVSPSTTETPASPTTTGLRRVLTQLMVPLRPFRRIETDPRR